MDKNELEKIFVITGKLLVMQIGLIDPAASRFPPHYKVDSQWIHIVYGLNSEQHAQFISC